MKKEWKLYPYDDCPNCGDALKVLSSCRESDDKDGVYVMDGDDVECMAGCGFKSAMSADEDGVWVQDGNIDELENK